MRLFIIRKILIVLIMLLPAAAYTSCKKQAKCGCGKDVIGSFDRMLMDRSSITYNTSGNFASFIITNAYGGYDTYDFCNPSEMYSKYKELEGEDQLLITGDYYWDCSYLMQTSGSSSYYYNYYKRYQINVTELKSYMYGKK